MQPATTRLRPSQSAHVMCLRASPLWQLLRGVCAGALIKNIIKVFVKLQLQDKLEPKHCQLVAVQEVQGGCAAVCALCCDAPALQQQQLHQLLAVPW